MEEKQENKQEITIISQVELEAVSRLTDGIRNDLKTAAQSLMRACINIAKVRDGKLYKALGCKNFEEYCENKLGIKRNQGLKYAAVGDFIQNAQSTVHFSTELLQNLNVEKLYLMAKTSEDIREEVAKAVDINDITVKELKSKISELERQYRDISDKLEKTEKNISEQVKSVEKNVGEIVRETIKSQPAPPESPAPENAPAKPSFILYSDYISFVEEFSDEEAGELFKAIMLYVNNRPVPELSKGVRIVFPMIIGQIERDYDKWEKKCQKRAESGKKGGLQTQKNKRELQAQLKRAKANQADNETVDEDVSEDVSVYDIEDSQSEVCPVVSKSDVEKLKATYGDKTIKRYIKKIEKWEKTSGKKVKNYAELIEQWIEQDGVKKIEKDDFDVLKYELLINRFDNIPSAPDHEKQSESPESTNSDIQLDDYLEELQKRFNQKKS